MSVRGAPHNDGAFAACHASAPRSSPTLTPQMYFYLDLRGFSRLDLVLPFLAVMRSREANGVLSDAALRSLQAFLGKRLMGEYLHAGFSRRFTCFKALPRG